MEGSASSSQDELLTSRQLRAFFGGVSDMWVWRRLADPALKFPRPIMICSRRYWPKREIIAWRDAQPRQING